MDLEKPFDRVPREVIRWAMHKLGVEEWLIVAVMSVYTGAQHLVHCYLCRVSHILRIQGCLTMGAVVC